jgi:uncharacterized protein YndB with AHSA1/START domain
VTKHEIRHEVGIKVAPAALYRALTDAKQLALWWIPDTRGVSEPGGALEFWLGEHCQEMQVTALEPDRMVRWRATDRGMPDWAGTEIEFALAPGDDRTVVTFRHAGWREITGTFGHCSMSWAVFLLSLKELAEKGKGLPFPNQWIHQ